MTPDRSPFFFPAKILRCAALWAALTLAPQAAFAQEPEGQLRLTSTGVVSDSYGSLAFQTPIIEMEMYKVSPEEKQLYERWRRGYQGNWSNFFDPIAVEFSVQEERLAADVTVMPLIDGSDYNELIGLSHGAELADDDGDPHPEALVHFVLALNTESEFMKQNLSVACRITIRICAGRR